MGDASTLDVGYKPIPLYAGRKCRASVHVVQVLAPLADEGVVVDDLEASEARAMSMPSDDDTESSAISRSGTDVDVPPVGSLVLRAVRIPGARLLTRGRPRRLMS